MAKKAPIPSKPQTILEWFDWVERVEGRIVWGEYRNGQKFCRVRADRYLDQEAETFVEAAEKCFERLRKNGDPKGNYMRTAE